MKQQNEKHTKERPFGGFHPAATLRKKWDGEPLAIIFLGNSIANNDIVMMMTKVMITKRNERIILRELIYTFSRNRLCRKYFSL